MSLKLDEYTKDPHLKGLIKGLLHPNPDLRISNFKEYKNEIGKNQSKVDELAGLKPED